MALRNKAFDYEHSKDNDMASAPPHKERLGPEYQSAAQKPRATVSSEVPHDNVVILPQTPQLIALLTYVPGCSTILSDARYSY